jgi:hypothetical protein
MSIWYRTPESVRSTQPPAPDADHEQLDLFSPISATAPESRCGIGAAQARSGVSPSWWPYLRELFEFRAAEIDILVCREVDGQLQLAAESRDRETDLSLLLQTIRDGVAGLCGACGLRPAHPYRANVDGPTRIVCDACRDRLKNGESYARIADETWRYDGSRRAHGEWATLGQAPRAEGRVGHGEGAASEPTFEALPPDELRRVIAEIRQRMHPVAGLEDEVALLSVIAGCHVGGGPAYPGARALLVGPSGAGKTFLMSTLKDALSPFRLPWIATDCLDLSSSAAWSGPSIGTIVAAGLVGIPVDSPRRARAIIFLDELSHIRVSSNSTSNTLAKERELIASLLGVAGRGTVHLGETAELYSTRDCLVIGAGAFSDAAFERPHVAGIIDYGIPVELATRLAETLIVLPRRLGQSTLVAILQQHPMLAGLIDVCRRLGFDVDITPEALGRVARVVDTGQEYATTRTGAGWLITALRHELIVALDDPSVRRLVVTPDALDIPPSALRPRPPEPPDDGETGWDARSRPTSR